MSDHLSWCLRQHEGPCGLSEAVEKHPKKAVEHMEIRPTEADYAWARNYRAHVGRYEQEVETLAAKLASVRGEGAASVEPPIDALVEAHGAGQNQALHDVALWLRMRANAARLGGFFEGRSHLDLVAAMIESGEWLAETSQPGGTER